MVFLFVAQKFKMLASAEHNFRTISIWENIVFFSETIKQYNIWIQTWFECSWHLMTLKKYIFVYIRNPRWSPLQDKVLRWNHNTCTCMGKKILRNYKLNWTQLYINNHWMHVVQYKKFKNCVYKKSQKRYILNLFKFDYPVPLDSKLGWNGNYKCRLCSTKLYVLESIRNPRWLTAHASTL